MSFQSKFSNSRYPPTPNTNQYKFVPTQPTGQIYFQKGYQSKTIQFRRKQSCNSRDSGKFSSSNSQSRIVNTNVSIISPINSFFATSNVSNVNRQYGIDAIPNQFDKHKQLFLKEKNQLLQRIRVLQNELSIKQSILRNKTDQSFYLNSQTSPYASSYSIQSNEQASLMSVNQQLKKLKQQSQKRFFKLIQKDNRCRKLQDENKKLQLQLNQCKRAIQKDQSYSDAKDYNHELGRIILENAQLNAEIKNKEDEIAAKIKIIGQLKNQLQQHSHGERKSLLAFKAPQIKDISAQLSRIKVENDKLKKDIQSKTQMITFLEHKCHRFQQQQQIKLVQLEKAPFSDAYTAKQRQRYYNNRNDQLQRQVNNLRKQVEAFKKQRIDLQDRIAELLKIRNTVIKLERQNEDLRHQLNIIKTSDKRSSVNSQSSDSPIRQTRRVKRQNIRLNQTIIQLQGKNKQRDSKIQYLNERIEKYLQDILENQQKLKKYQRQVSSLKEQLRQVANIKDVEQTNFKLTKAHSQIERKQKQNQTLHAKYNIAEMEVEKIRLQLENSKNKISSILTDNADLTHQLTKQRENLSHLERQLNQTKNKYQNQIDRLNGENQIQQNLLHEQIKALEQENHKFQLQIKNLSLSSEQILNEKRQCLQQIEALTNELKHKQQEISFKNAQMKDKQRIIQNFKQNILSTANQQLKSYKAKINKYTMQKAATDQQLSQKNQTIQKLQEEIKQQAQIIQKLQEEIKQKTTTIEEQTNSLIQCTNLIQDLQSKQKVLQEQNNNQKLSKAQKQQEIQRQLQIKQKQIQEYQKNERSFTSDILTLKQQVKKQKSKRSNKELEINQLRETLSKFQTKVKQLEIQLHHKEQEIQIIHQNQQKLGENTQRLTQQLAKTQQQIVEYQNIVNQHTQYKQELVNEIQRINNNFTTVQKQLEISKLILEKQQQQLKAYQSQRQSNSYEYSQQQKSNQKLSILQSTIQEKQSFIFGLEQQIACSQQQIDSLVVQNDQLKQNLKILEQEIQNLTERIKESDNKYANILDIAKNRSSELQQAEIKQNLLIQNNNDLKKQISQLAEKLRLRVQQESITEDKMHYQQSKTAEMQLMKQKIQELTQKISIYQCSQFKDEKEQNKSQQKLTEQIIRLTQQIQDLENNLDMFKLDNSKLLEQNISLEAEKNNLMRKIKTLSEKIQNLQKTIVEPTIKISIDESINDISKTQNSKLQQITSQLIYRLQQSIDRIKTQQIDKQMDIELNKIESIINQLLEIFQQEIDYYEEKLAKAKQENKKNISRSITTIYCDEYLDVLDLFGVDQSNQDHHQFLLSQINSFRDTIKILMNKVSSHQSQMKQIKKAKSQLKRAKQILHQQIAALEDKNYRNQQIIHSLNQRIMIFYIQKVNKMLGDENTAQQEGSLIDIIKQQKSSSKLPRPKSVSQLNRQAGIQQILNNYSIGYPQPEKDTSLEDIR